jgi:hypothetical protein
VFRWSQTEIIKWPQELMPFVQSVSVAQPGANDDGQAYTPVFDRCGSATDILPSSLGKLQQNQNSLRAI